MFDLQLHYEMEFYHGQNLTNLLYTYSPVYNYWETELVFMICSSVGI